LGSIQIHKMSGLILRHELLSPRPQYLTRQPTVQISQFYQPCPLPLGAPPFGDTSLTHVMKLAAHSTKPPTPTTMVQ
jgi:hypothetical protein